MSVECTNAKFGCGRVGCSKCYPMEDKMNDLCGACGKPNHPGGCKVGPNTPEQNKALESYAHRAKPKCGICMSPDHEITDCPKATSPRTIEVPGGEVPVAETFAEMSDPDSFYLHTGHLHPQMADLLRECLEVQRVKGGDYTKRSKDRLANFKREAEKWGISMEQAWGVYFDKHLCAIESYVLFGQVESEPIRGRIVDAINYLLLLYLIVREKDPEAP